MNKHFIDMVYVPQSFPHTVTIQFNSDWMAGAFADWLVDNHDRLWLDLLVALEKEETHFGHTAAQVPVFFQHYVEHIKKERSE